MAPREIGRLHENPRSPHHIFVETYGHMDGTMYIPMSASAVMELTKDRALFLKSLKELISER